MTNQVPPLTGHDTADYAVFEETLRREGATAALDELHEIGRQAGSAHAIALGDRAEAHPPVLHTHDRYGHRIDQVAYDAELPRADGDRRRASACTARRGRPTTRTPTSCAPPS